VDPVPDLLLLRKSGSRESIPGTLDPQPGTLTTITQRRSTSFYITYYINSVRTSQEAQYISVMKPGTLTARPQRRSAEAYVMNIFVS
jgi:hypothetical protein